MKVGLVLEGGAMRGIYTAGVIDELLENNIKIDTIIGVSAGALFGINYKSNQKGRVIRYNKKYLKDKDYLSMHSLIRTGNIMNKDLFFNKIVYKYDPFDFNTFRNNDEDFYLVVTNVETGKAEYIKIDDIDKKEQMEYLRASGSMPYVSKMVEINGNKYLDGALADSIPIKKMMEFGMDKIIVVSTKIKGYQKKKGKEKIAKIFYKNYPNLIKTINNRYKMYNEQIKYIESLEQNKKIILIRPSIDLKIKRLEKNIDKIDKLYNLGICDTHQIIDDIKTFIE